MTVSYCGGIGNQFGTTLAAKTTLLNIRAFNPNLSLAKPTPDEGCSRYFESDSFSALRLIDDLKVPLDMSFLAPSVAHESAGIFPKLVS